jgi:hypothetical protein
VLPRIVWDYADPGNEQNGSVSIEIELYRHAWLISCILVGGRRELRVKLSIDATGKDETRLVTKTDGAAFIGLARKRVYTSTSSLPKTRLRQRYVCKLLP